MGNIEPKTIVIFSSPAGSTRQVAQIIIKTLNDLGKKPIEVDTANRVQLSNLQLELRDLGPGSCLFIGSPVYANHAVPPIVDVISRLPKTAGCCAVPFVTWGAVTSGIALYEMAEMVFERGYKIIGAAKIIAVHSMMWQFASPLGEGHPDTEDELLIKNLVEEVNAKLSYDKIHPLSLQDLNYQPIEAQEVMKKVTMEVIKGYLPPIQLDKELCTQCGICADVCPAQAITCEPFPQRGAECFFCYNCVRLCPEGANKADFSLIEKRLKNRTEDNAEKPLSQIFV